MVSILKNIGMYILLKLIVLNIYINKLINLPAKVDKTFNIIPKVTGATTGTDGVAKSVGNFLEL